MKEHPKASPALGLSRSTAALKAACLQYKNKRIELVDLFSIPIEFSSKEGEFNVKPLYTEQEGTLLRSLTEKCLVSTVITTKETLVRHLELNLKREKDIDAVLEFQTEPLLPFSVEEGMIDRLIIEQKEEHSSLTVLATKSSKLFHHLEVWKELSIDPEVVSSTPQALAAFAQHFCTEEDPFFILHLSNEENALLLIKNQQLNGAQALSQKINENGNNETFILEVKRGILALKKQFSLEMTPRILFTGEYNTIRKELLKKLEAEELSISPKKGFNEEPEKLEYYAISIGCALTTLPTNTAQINFRQKELAYSNPWKRIKQPIGMYFGLCLVLSAFIYFFGNSIIAKKEDVIKQEYVNLLSLTKQPFIEVEEKVTGNKPETPPENILKGFSQKDLQTRLYALEQEISATPDIFALYPNVPKVTDVLAWLSTHPAVVGQTEIKEPKINLKSLSYKLLKRPEQKRKREKYQVKVDIEFTAMTPRDARELHDMLLTPNKMIDSKGGVKWSAERERYRASFFLKDKTSYPAAQR